MREPSTFRTSSTRRSWWLALLCGFVGCESLAFLSPLTLPDGLSTIPGGVADGRPYFGKSYDGFNTEKGLFVLATCGCGDWRVLVKDDDGSQVQFPIRFYTSGPYDPAGEVTFFGEEEGMAALGTVDQNTGATTGSVDLQLFRRRFTAERRETHTNDIEACIICHIGTDPIYPQPETHPPYVEGVTNCLQCHEVVIE